MPMSSNYLSVPFGAPGSPLVIILSASLSLLACDLMENLVEDRRLVTEYKLSFPLFTYWIARISTYAYFVGAFAYYSNMNSIIGIEIIVWFVLVQRASTSLLLYFRVHALHRSNRYIQIFFVSYLLAIVASHIAITVAFITSKVKPSTICYCHNPCFVPFILLGFDSCIIIAFIQKVKAGYLPEEDRKQGWWLRNVFHPRSMHELASRLLQDNLVYYMMTVLLKTIWIGATATGNANFIIASIYLDTVCVCIITCKIYRDMRLGLPGLVHVTVEIVQGGGNITPLNFASPSGGRSTPSQLAKCGQFYVTLQYELKSPLTRARPDSRDQLVILS
ncbi:hypothetical protein CPB83DRAFT_911541 [Crepidotus variabilis]|uniref:Uncharacterized protein n=1 Tax=Crepidotus variabilis TaxID=179855 RepID=A0A9P6E417_9AGAR|nr:hypothetical protein CPB83DRAFT_911541 [Crepidotus variabilis]